MISAQLTDIGLHHFMGKCRATVSGVAGQLAEAAQKKDFLRTSTTNNNTNDRPIATKGPSESEHDDDDSDDADSNFG